MRLEYSIANSKELRKEKKFPTGTQIRKVIAKLGRNWMGILLVLMFGSILIMSLKHDKLFIEELLLGGGIAFGLLLLHVVNTFENIISEN